MANRDTYTPQHWENLPSEKTPITAERLKYIEDGIKNAADKRALKELYGDTGINIGNNTVSGNSGNYAVLGEGNFLNDSSALLLIGANNRALYASAGICLGDNNTIGGRGNLVSGSKNEAQEGYSGAIGVDLRAVAYQTVVGKYNQKDEQHQYAFAAGGGTSDTDRKNIHTLDWQGNAVFAGNVTDGKGDSIQSVKEEIPNEESLDIDFSNYFI